MLVAWEEETCVSKVPCSACCKDSDLSPAQCIQSNLTMACRSKYTGLAGYGKWADPLTVAKISRAMQEQGGHLC